MSQHTGPKSPGQAHPDTAQQHAGLADVALIDAAGVAAAGCISISTWHELVRAGKAPQPAFRAPRCTRWRLADVRAWLVEFASRGTDAAVVERARQASLKARAPVVVEKVKATRKARAAARAEA